MKIAVPVIREDRINDHFGQTENFKVYTISSEKEIVSVKTIPSANGCGCKSGIAGVLAEEGVKVMLAGGIGDGAINVLSNSGIDVIRGCSGEPDENVRRYINGQLSDNGSSCDHHEDHHHHHHHDNHSTGGSHSCTHN